jgi:hypothetical protein
LDLFNAGSESWNYAPKSDCTLAKPESRLRLSGVASEIRKRAYIWLVLPPNSRRKLQTADAKIQSRKTWRI